MRSLSPTLTRPPLQLGRLPQLGEADLRGCPGLRTMAREVTETDPVATAELLREMSGDGVVPNTQVVCVAVGEGEAGKTSFLNAIVSDQDCSGDIPVDQRTGQAVDSPMVPTDSRTRAHATRGHRVDR